MEIIIGTSVNAKMGLQASISLIVKVLIVNNIMNHFVNNNRYKRILKNDTCYDMATCVNKLPPQLYECSPCLFNYKGDGIDCHCNNGFNDIGAGCVGTHSPFPSLSFSLRLLIH